MWKQRVCLVDSGPRAAAAGSSGDEVACCAEGPKQQRVLLHQGEKIPFPYLKAIYWVRVQGKSVWVAEWRTECFCGLWISPPPRLCNSILGRADGISAALQQQHKQTLSASTQACWWTQSALIKDLSTLCIKTLECEEHIMCGCFSLLWLFLRILFLKSYLIKISTKSKTLERCIVFH